MARFWFWGTVNVRKAKTRNPSTTNTGQIFRRWKRTRLDKGEYGAAWDREYERLPSPSGDRQIWEKTGYARMPWNQKSLTHFPKIDWCSAPQERSPFLWNRSGVWGISPTRLHGCINTSIACQNGKLRCGYSPDLLAILQGNPGRTTPVFASVATLAVLAILCFPC